MHSTEVESGVRDSISRVSGNFGELGGAGGKVRRDRVEACILIFEELDLLITSYKAISDQVKQLY